MTTTIAPTSVKESEGKEFKPGTTGWTASDLDDPEIERQWESDAYEIVEGVLTIMPPAYLDGSAALHRLVRLVEVHLASQGTGGLFAPEADVIVEGKRVPRPDMVYLSDADLKRQEELNAQHGRGGRRKRKYGRILVPPTLIIESVSEGHEAHDREVKRLWYCNCGVRNYWLLDAHTRALECLSLRGAEYEVDVAGKHEDELRPSFFPGLIIPLGKVWL